MNSVYVHLLALELVLDDPELTHLHYLLSQIALAIFGEDPTPIRLSFTPSRVNTIIIHCLRWLHQQEVAYLATQVLELTYQIAAGIGVEVEGTTTVRVIIALDEVKSTRKWFREMVSHTRTLVYLLAMPLALVFYHMAFSGASDIGDRLFYATMAVAAWRPRLPISELALIQQLFQQMMLRLPKHTLKPTRLRLDAIYDETFAT